MTVGGCRERRSHFAQVELFGFSIIVFVYDDGLSRVRKGGLVAEPIRD